MTEYSTQDLAGNPVAEQMEVASPFAGTGTPDDAAAEMAEAFAWGREEAADEVDAHYAAWFRRQAEDFAREARDYSDDQLVAAVELADDPRDPLNLGGRRVPFMNAVTAEVLRRAEAPVVVPQPAA